MGSSYDSTRGMRVSSVILAVSLLFFLILLFGEPANSYTIGPNYRNISVDTRANITNAAPEVIRVRSVGSVTLVAGGIYSLEVNVTVRDYNGFADIDDVNATLHHYTSSFGAANDNNTHYFNATCAQTEQEGFYANYSCIFGMYYYALNGTWTMTVYANDTRDFRGNNTNTTSVNVLYALNVTSLIDYGELAIYDTSANRTANITNFGNANINVTVYGYGATPNDGLAMVCQVGNITISNERYSADISADFAAKQNLTSSPVSIPGFIVGKQTAPETQIINTTYWQLYVPPNPFGACNGTVVFQAEQYRG